MLRRLLFSLSGEFQAPSLGLESKLQSVTVFPQWIHVDINIVDTVPRKTEGETDPFGMCGHLTCSKVLLHSEYNTTPRRASDDSGE